MTPFSVLILAAGEGTRMRSALPKVLHQAAGKALVEHVLEAASVLKGAAAGVVLGRGADQVKALLGDRGVSFFLQKERLGSGHAVKSAAVWLKRRGGDAMVLCGDAPLLKPGTVRALAALHRKEKNAATLLTARVDRPAGYGRIVRGADGRVSAIVEEKDASPAQRSIDEINSGTYCFRAAELVAALSRLRPDNAKGEYYITDVVAMLVAAGRPVGALEVEGAEECLGVNTRAELAVAERVLRRREVDRLMAGGVTVLDPEGTYVDAGVEVGPDTVIWPQTYLLGGTRVGAGCRIGPWSFLKDCRVADGAVVKASFAEDAEIGLGAAVGPYSRLRGGTRLGPDVRVGNFVEVKKSFLARGVKAGHLAYLGDAEVGAEANIGAGAITCNYDGFVKSATRIGAGAFVGSNANLVAPLRVGAGAVVGAGSTVTQDVPAGALALERSRMILKPGWVAERARRRPRKEKHG
jgi:bifunctional UDP-N-acetylglucosamine pyrophosphorylase / glucosamine-1-phosphate N-acetyltransferase